MCGIAGILDFDPRARVDAARLVRMRDTLRHRGPDGEGAWIDGPVGLGHRRLAIVDIAGGGQPMAGEDGSIRLVCNGEIYNHADLRREIESRGHRCRTHSDNETILHLYEEEGEDCVGRLRGMFAFALWDGRRRRLLLARDRLGIKPLYYAWTGRELLFASEIKAILAAAPFRPELNEAVLDEYLANRFVADDATFFRGVRKVLPGTVLTWSADGRVSGRRYWRPPAGGAVPGSVSGNEPGRLRARLEEAVQIHLMSDVPIGLFLSGGVDSSALLALMAPLVAGPVRTFSVGFREPEANELASARLMARAAGAEHREVVVTDAQFFAALPRLVWHEDEPIAFPSSVPLYFVSRLAAEHVKVVLTGEGADELFLGYNRYRVTAWNDSLARVYGSLLPEPARRMVGRLARSLPGFARRYTDRTFLALDPGPRGQFYENFAVFPEPLRRRLIPDSRRADGADPHGTGLRLWREAGGGVLTRMAHADLQTYLVELLMKQDQMSMAASIESRVPFLDHRFVEYAAMLPDRLKVRGVATKVVLRDALRGLVPRPILKRRKMGFPVPVGRWIRGPFLPAVREFVLGTRARRRGLFNPSCVARLVAEHAAGRADHGDRLWLLINLEIWQRIFLDGEDPSAVVFAGRPAAAGRGLPR